MCRLIHGFVENRGFALSVICVANYLIDAYGKCRMGKEAIFTFKEMERFVLKPNGITLLSVLTACSRGGLAEEGLEIFNKYQINPDVKHNGCLVDMLGRSGRLEEAEEDRSGDSEQR
ncbi:PREDICTED: pentatricopeptide repeat-containing protein At1g09220, mitochondrial-like [Tarenaya hassleriana]|uniref:pentatricopeptide repeat-containing protein At1g09220, mitochondrial-like n=1 Tax=Tarenaya hassleriana TaxID=28532 RepID=UPI0008FD27BC|nr:PREDICTED: pentatricopeptide repeat-containing protein At1g09220, mitochondrial-like [Tarenaya hassleriana]